MNLKRLSLISTLGSFLVLSSLATAGPTCTNDPENTWQNTQSFQQKLEQEGYRIKKFKVTSGHCYEIYGWDPESHKVEIYFHPVTGKIVKKEMED